MILFRYDKEDIFHAFIDDVIPKMKIVSLSKLSYNDLVGLNKDYGIDFDDAYQLKIAEENGLEIVTMDSHFEDIKDKTKIVFL